jgi:hypothetical protein
VADGFDDHSMLSFVDPIDDPVIAATGAAETLEFEAKRMADPLRHRGKRSVDELDGGERNPSRVAG